MNKGISLPVNMVIILIIAVIVLGVSLAFLLKVGSPGMDEAANRQLANKLCTQYVGKDPTCSDTSKADSELLEKLAATCAKLNYTECLDIADVSCVKKCCSLFCSE